jgi:LysM repeat protein
MSWKIRKKRLISLVFLIIMSIGLPPSLVHGEEIVTPALNDLDVVETDIRDVFRSLAELGDLNILLDPTVQGPVTIKLKQGLTVKESLELLAQTHGHSFRWVPGSRTVIIGNEKTFDSFIMKETKIYQLRYAQTDQVVTALKVAIPIDQIGIDKRTNQLTIKASILEHQNIGELIARLDQEMPQLNIEARVEEISRSAGKDLGLTWAFDPLKSGLNFQVTTTATLQMLEEQNKSRTLARPNISTTDSQKGKIFIGDKVPVITSSQTNDGVQYTINYVEVGTLLEVTPRINENNTVTVAVNAGVSSITEWKKSGDGGDIPVIRTRESSSVIRLREGDTFVLSGLNQTMESRGTTKVPGMSKIPLFGRLFQNKKDEDEDTELCIFLTPRIIRYSNPESPLAGSAPSLQPQAEVKLSELPIPGASSPGTSSPANPTPTVAEANVKAENLGNSAVSVTENTPKPELPNNAQPVGKTETKDTVDSIPIINISGANSNPSSSEDNAAKDNIASGPDKIKAVAEAPVEIKKSMELPELVAEIPPAASPEPSAGDLPDESLDPLGLIVKLKVKPGDTLFSFARKYGVTVDGIRQENGLKPNEMVKSGQILSIRIPKDHLYQLKPKETLWRVAKRYGVPLETLQVLNNITDVSKLEIGQIIILPVSVEKVVNKNF